MRAFLLISKRAGANLSWSDTIEKSNPKKKKHKKTNPTHWNELKSEKPSYDMKETCMQGSDFV